MYMFLYNKIVWLNIILELYLSFLGGMELVAIYTPPNKYLMIYLILEFCVVLQIMFGPSEYVKEISGHGHKANTSYLCQLKIVTNYCEYGPFGEWTGIPFRFTVPENETVVGFFGSYDTSFVTKIGAYLISK